MKTLIKYYLNTEDKLKLKKIFYKTEEFDT